MPPGTQVGPFSEVRCSLKCIFRDESNQNTTTVENLPSSTTILDLYKILAEKQLHNQNTFNLIYLKPRDQADEEVYLDKHSLKTIAEITKRDPSVENIFIIRKLTNGKEPVENSDDESPLGIIGPILKDDPPSYGAASMSSSTNFSSAEAPERAFTGLINQAMTCYLNSLLQTLYMTPEFRNALYKWEYQGVEADAEKCIPFQLQKLFLKMQTTKKHSVETTDLTHSFGWDSSEAWQQHDVQELCRVMFDALEETLKHTDQEHLINQLYQGKMKDYVKCLKCGYESARADTYLDIPLAIRPFGAQEAHESLSAALQEFVRSETLDGNNQYFCEKCNSKQDAQKGLKFETFPYLLTFQLKRFTFDYTTLQRIKLHDRLTFPHILNMNQCCKDLCNNFDTLNLSDDKPDEEAHSKEQSSQKESNDLPQSESDCNGVTDEAPASHHNCVANGKEQPNLQYELFSIMIHSGNALGGHYYAYIKSFTDQKWYCFNDQSVGQISQAEIENSYGGSEKRARQFYSSNYASSTNAYMLLYRQIDSKKNTQFLSKETWPEHIKDLANQLEKEESEEEAEKERDRNTCKIRIFAKHPVTHQLLENRLEIHKDKSLIDAAIVAKKLFGFVDLVADEDCRLIKYDSTYESYERSYEGQENDAIQDVLGGMRYAYGFDLFLEIKEPGTIFPEYKIDGSTMKVFDVDITTRKVKLNKIIHMSCSNTIDQLKDYLQESLGYAKEHSRIVLGRSYNDFRLLSNGTMTLKFEGFGKSSKIFVEASGQDDELDCFNRSKLLNVLEEFANTIKLNVTLPFINQTTNAYEEIVVFVDKRSKLQDFKKIVEPLVKIPADDFRVYKILSSNQELESTKLNEPLTLFIDDMKIIIRPGKALQVGEARAKIFHFKPNDSTPISFFMEAIIATNSTILDIKQNILPEVMKNIDENITIERIRLRKKSWKNPSQILLDKVRFGHDVGMGSAMEFLVEILKGPDRIESGSDRSIYAKRWRPSSHTFDPFVEVIVRDESVDHLKEELSLVSSIPVSDIEIAKGHGIFPCDICPLDVARELDWDPKTRTLHSYPLSINEDGAVIYFRDKNEQLEELKEEDRQKLKETSNQKRPQHPTAKQPIRSNRSSKEKALKIYTNKNSKI